MGVLPDTSTAFVVTEAWSDGSPEETTGLLFACWLTVTPAGTTLADAVLVSSEFFVVEFFFLPVQQLLPEKAVVFTRQTRNIIITFMLFTPNEQYDNIMVEQVSNWHHLL